MLSRVKRSEHGFCTGIIMSNYCTPIHKMTTIHCYCNLTKSIYEQGSLLSHTWFDVSSSTIVAWRLWISVSSASCLLLISWSSESFVVISCSLSLRTLLCSINFWAFWNKDNSNQSRVMCSISISVVVRNILGHQNSLQCLTGGSIQSQYYACVLPYQWHIVWTTYRAL